MRLIEKIETMQHFERGGEVQFNERKNEKETWLTVEKPSWNWEIYDYRIKPKPAEILYEWWYQTSNSPRIYLNTSLYTEAEAKDKLGVLRTYGKTGRYFNPITKKFEVEK